MFPSHVLQQDKIPNLVLVASSSDYTQEEKNKLCFSWSRSKSQESNEGILEATYVSTKSNDSDFLWLLNPVELMAADGKGELATCLQAAPLEVIL